MMPSKLAPTDAVCWAPPKVTLLSVMNCMCFDVSEFMPLLSLLIIWQFVRQMLLITSELLMAAAEIHMPQP